jgi:DNA-binding MarR family transcriptional regulator
MKPSAARRKVRRSRVEEAKPPASFATASYRITDYPLHYFAAIQWQNQLNLARALRKLGLSVPMWRALAALQQRNGQTIGEIAQLAVVDRSSLGRLLESLAKNGLVERESLPDDRRAVAIRLSPAGRKLFEQALPLVQAHYERLLTGVSNEEFETLMRVLRRIKANSRLMADIADIDA